MSTTTPQRTGRTIAALMAGLAILASSCSLLGTDSSSSSADDAGPGAVESGLDTAGEPKRGGQLVYGLEAEVSAKGYCLPEAELAISGMQVAKSLYDTLTVPDAQGEYVPFLAKAIDHDKTYKEWTITLRPGIVFHDGSKLDATVVKNNLDAYRGQYPGRSPLLFTFVLDNIASVDTINELTVRVTTE
jgi:peptide/nickel transport system substrate-binding protein